MGLAGARRLLSSVVAQDGFFLHRREVLFVLLGDLVVEQIRLVWFLFLRGSIVEDAAQVCKAGLVEHLVAQFGLLHLHPEVYLAFSQATAVRHIQLRVKFEQIAAAGTSAVRIIVSRRYTKHSLCLLQVLHSFLTSLNLLSLGKVLGGAVHFRDVGHRWLILTRVDDHEI